jgi:hypothetical protein
MTDSASSDRYFLTLEMTENCRQVFRKAVDFENWLEDEKRFLVSLHTSDPGVNQTALLKQYPELFAILSNIQTHLNQLKPSDTGEQIDWEDLENRDRNVKNYRNGIKASVKKLYSTSDTDGIGIPPPGSSKRAGLEDATSKIENSSLRKGVFEGFLFPNFTKFSVSQSSNNKDQDAGRLFGKLLFAGLLPNNFQVEEAVQRYEIERAALNSLLQESTVFKKTQLETFQQLKEKGDDLLAETEGNFQRLIEAKNTELIDQISKMETQLSEFKLQQQRAISLKGPLTYWEEKGKTHETRAKSSLVNLKWTGGVSLAVVVATAYFFGDKFSTFSEINVLHSAILIVTITGWLWAVKTLLRNYLSNTHLMNDAEERLAMTKSYLALQESDKPIEGDSLAPVLHALFRPAGDGIVKEEGPPLAFVELLSRGNK